MKCCFNFTAHGTQRKQSLGSSSETTQQQHNNVQEQEGVSQSQAESRGRLLTENVKKIQTALAEATKYSHCHDCLLTKKSTAPDLLCLDCGISFCHRSVLTLIFVELVELLFVQCCISTCISGLSFQ
jgi:hypothetical protein